MPQAHVAGSGIAIPYLVSTEQFLNIDERMRRAHGQSEKIIQRLRSFSEGTRIHTCHYLHPHWLTRLETPGELPTGALTEDIFTPNNFLPPYQ